MQKKSILAIVIIIVLLAVVGYLGYNQYMAPNNQVKVGEATFNLPEGFYEGTLTESGNVNITNGLDTLFLKECGNENITKYTKNYVKNKEADNITVKINNFTVDNQVVYKSHIVNGSGSTHYWFEYNGNVYTGYSWNSESNIDKIITDIITSSK